MKKLLSIVLCLCLVLSTFITNYAADNNEAKDNFSKNQEEGLKAYKSIKEHLDKIKKGDKDVKDNANMHSIKNYAGAYIDSEGILNIRIVGKTDSDFKEIRDLSGYDKFKLNNAEISLEDLIKIQIQIVNSIETFKKVDVNIDAVDVSETNNKVFVYVKDLDSNSEKIIKEVFNSPAIQFLNSAEPVVPLAGDAVAGTEILADSGAGDGTFSTGTLSFCAKDINGNKGLVTAGHVTASQIGSWVSYQGPFANNQECIFTSVTTRAVNSTCDAAFMKVNSSDLTKITNRLVGIRLIKSWSSSQYLVEGQAVEMFGKTSGVKSGEIVTVNASASITGSGTCTNLIKIDYQMAGGDSGGPLTFEGQQRDGGYKVIGIMRAGGGGYTYCVPFEKVISGLNLDSIITY